MLLLAHSETNYRDMGQLVGKAKAKPIHQLFAEYQQLLLKTIAEKSTPKTNTNVLQHALGYFKEQLTSDEKQEMIDIIDNYRTGIVPLIVPITLLNHYVRKHNQPYLRDQVYLHPHPTELQLRNHV